MYHPSSRPSNYHSPSEEHYLGELRHPQLRELHLVRPCEVNVPSELQERLEYAADEVKYIHDRLQYRSKGEGRIERYAIEAEEGVGTIRSLVFLGRPESLGRTSLSSREGTTILTGGELLSLLTHRLSEIEGSFDEERSTDVLYKSVREDIHGEYFHPRHREGEISRTFLVYQKPGYPDYVAFQMKEHDGDKYELDLRTGAVHLRLKRDGEERVRQATQVDVAAMEATLKPLLEWAHSLFR